MVLAAAAIASPPLPLPIPIRHTPLLGTLTIFLCVPSLPASLCRVLAASVRVNADGAALGSVASPRRANPFLDDPATTPQVGHDDPNRTRVNPAPPRPMPLRRRRCVAPGAAHALIFPAVRSLRPSQHTLPEAAPFVGMPSMLRRDGSTDEYPVDTKPEPSIVSSEEFVRMQNELMALRNFKYESLERA